MISLWFRFCSHNHRTSPCPVLSDLLCSLMSTPVSTALLSLVGSTVCSHLLCSVFPSCVSTVDSGGSEP